MSEKGAPRRAMAAGLAGTAAVMVGGAVLHTLVPSVPFLPMALAQSLVRAAPGGLATFFIEVLGHLALPLSVVLTAALMVLSGAPLGLLSARLEAWFRGHAYAAMTVGLLPLWAVCVALYPTDPQSVRRGVFALVTLPVYLVAGAVSAGVSRRLREVTGPLAAAGGPSSDRPSDPTRRVFLRSLWFGAAAVALGASGLGGLIRRRPDPGLQVLRVPNLIPATVPPPQPGDTAFASIPGLTREVTPTDEFYVVDEEIVDPDLDPDTWRLAIGGLVGRPFALDYRTLERFPVVERYQTLECISNEVGGDLMSTAKWAGVPLPLLLERANVSAGAAEVVFRAAGGYADSLSISQAMDERTLIAVGMNDHVLPRAHGFPARLLSVGTYGMKNPKWLVGVEVVARPYQGFWERRGWSKAAVVKTGSRIDTPADGSRPATPVTIAGVAFAGDRGVSRVEVSPDGGATWYPAALKTALSGYTWRQWAHRWVAPAGSGRRQVLVRAYDGDGVPQSPRPAPPHPDGSAGYDTITLVV